MIINYLLFHYNIPFGAEYLFVALYLDIAKYYNYIDKSYVNQNTVLSPMQYNLINSNEINSGFLYHICNHLSIIGLFDFLAF